jgi:hypothetical protein
MNLPAGFQLENTANDNSSHGGMNLPPGFQLENQPQQQPQNDTLLNKTADFLRPASDFIGKMSQKAMQTLPVTNPIGMSFRANSLLQKPFDWAGEKVTEGLGGSRIPFVSRPEVAAMTGTVVQNIPAIFQGVAQGMAPENTTPKPISEYKTPADISYPQEQAMKSYGVTKRFLNNPQKVRQQSQTAQTLLDQGAIKPWSTAKSLLNTTQDMASNSGKGIGDYLSSLGKDGKILPQEFEAQMEGLRPVQPDTGKILQGGKYDAINSKIDDAINTIRAHGDNPISFEEANRLKGVLQDSANFQSNKEATLLDKVIAGKFRDTLDNVLNRVSNRAGNPQAHQAFLKNKEIYAAAQRAQDPLYNKLSSELGNKGLSLTDWILGAGELSMGHPLTALGAVGGKKLLESFAPQTKAVVSNALTKTPSLSPISAVASKLPMLDEATARKLWNQAKSEGLSGEAAKKRARELMNGSR